MHTSEPAEAQVVRSPEVVREPRDAFAVMGRSVVAGALLGALLALVAVSPDVVKAWTDPEFGASYGGGGLLLVALPIGALVGLGCAVVTAAVFLWAEARRPRSARLVASVAAAVTILVLGLVLGVEGLPVTLVAASVTFGIAYGAAPYLTSRRVTPVPTG